MAKNDELVRVFREDGSGLKLKRSDADAFIAANPGATIEGQRQEAKAEPAAPPEQEAKPEPEGATFPGEFGDAFDAPAEDEAPKAKAGKR